MRRATPSRSVPETLPCHAQVMILTLDKEKGPREACPRRSWSRRLATWFATPSLVYARADEMAQAFR